MSEENNDFPAMMYKPGTQYKSDGVEYDCMTVNDAKEMTAAKKDGWFEHFSKFPKEKTGK